MYKLSGPDRLENIAKETLLNYVYRLTLYLQDNKNEAKFNELKDFLDKYPSFHQLRNEFLDIDCHYKNEFRFIEKEVLNIKRSDFIYSIMKLLLNSEMKSLKLANLPHFVLRYVFNLIITKCPDLEVLDLSNLSLFNQINLSNKLVNDLNYLLKSLKKLRVLHFHSAYDIILISIFKYCPNLEELYIKNKLKLEDIDKSLINFLKQSNKFTILDLGNTTEKDVSVQIIAEIISYMPYLKAIRGYKSDLSSVKIAVALIFDILELTELKDIHTTKKLMNILIERCPNIEKLHLIDSKEDALPMVTQFKKLSKLILEDCPYTDILKCMDIWEKEEVQITHLEITFSTDEGKQDLVNLHKILKTFPNLTYLKSNVLSFDFATDRMLECPNLKTLQISGDTIKPYYFDSINMPNIEYFEIINWLCVTHREIAKYMSETQWDKLKYLSINKAPILGLNTVFSIIKNCPCIEHIHSIDTWGICKDTVSVFGNIMKNRKFYSCIYCDTRIATF